jgi:TetR/AcrR family transcriptional regulator, cholesterol catabolism regulator
MVFRKKGLGLMMDDKKDIKKKQIRKAVAELFAQKGFEHTTTRDIAKTTHMSNGGIYYYFDSKESLLCEILDDIFTEGLKTVKKIEQSDRSLKEKLAAIIDFHTRYFAVDMNKMKLLAEEQRKCVTPKFIKRLNKVQRDYLEVLVKILDGLKEQGELANLNTTVTAFAFFGMVHWTYRWYNPDGKVKPDTLSKTFNQIFTRGILQPV